MSLRLRLRRIVVSVIAAVALSACAMSPGMYMGSPADAQRQLESDERFKSGDVSIGRLVSIDAELLKQQRQRSPAVEDVSHLYADAGAYRVGPGDILNIIVWDHPELSLAAATAAASIEGGNVGTGYNVSRDGRIQFPFAGAVKVAGLTELQVRDKLTKLLAVYITDPQLTVQVRTYRNSRVYVEGEVNSPGLLNVDDIPMTLLEALNRAGGFTPNADRSTITLSRNGQKTTINLARLIDQGINPNRVLLKHGDILRVEHRDKTKVFLIGEVLSPQALTMHDGELTLAQALGEAGGASIASNPGQIYVIRNGVDGKADIYHLDANSPVALILASGFQLQPRDLVYIDPARVVRWNRVISNIVPSYGAVVSTIDATR